MSGSRIVRAGAAGLVAAALSALLVAPAGAKTKTRTFTSGPLAAPIQDAGLNLYPLNVKAKGKVKKVRVAMRIAHAFDSDLDIYLVSPRARFVQLSTDNGGTDNDYGSGALDCTGTMTTFDDAAATPIAAAAAPFAGTFQPQQPLSALKRSKAKGEWKLLISDDDPGDAGTLGCWELRIAAKTKRK